jgi:uncharacterized protein (TIGR02145 family)
MLSPRLTNCPECANIPSLLKKIDCKLAELGNSLYNNVSYMLNQPIPAGDILQLIAYRRILTHKYCNPNYLHEYSVAMIASRVIRITVGCVSRCNTPEPCLEVPCDITIVQNPSTTTTSTLPPPPTTTTTTTSSGTTTTTTTICQDCIAHDVTIGTQVWTGCNASNSTYRDGTIIPEEPITVVWPSLTTGAWCYYNNDPANEAIYGKIYNWYAVAGIYDAASLADPSLRKQFAPTGYHVPSDEEWTTLVDYLGGNVIAGGHLKQPGFCYWHEPNADADDTSAFTGLPAGYREGYDGIFGGLSFQTYFWTDSNAEFGLDAWTYQLRYTDGFAVRNFHSLTNGFSVRLIKDTEPITTTTTTTAAPTTSTTTTCSPIHPYNINLAQNINTSPLTFTESLITACAAVSCLNAGTCSITGITIGWWDTPNPTVGSKLFIQAEGCVESSSGGWFAINIPGTPGSWQVVHVVTGVIVSYPTC